MSVSDILDAIFEERREDKCLSGASSCLCCTHFNIFVGSINPIPSPNYSSAVKRTQRKNYSIPHPLLHPLSTLYSLQMEEVKFSLLSPNNKA